MKTVSINNQRFSATIDLHGAQLTSLLDKVSEEEFIWQRDPAFWAESAPICFPIVGDLKGGTYQYNGQTYTMKKHGVVRYADFSLESKSEGACTLIVKADAGTLKAYPFLFTLAITFQLTEEGLRVAYNIRNEDHKDMPTSLGYHPAFNIDVEHYSHSDYFIEFSQPESLDLYWLKDGVLALKTAQFLDGESILPLHAHIFDDDALIFKDIASDAISLRRKGSDWRVRMLTGGAPHLGIWAKPAAPYVCIEPWYTYQDSATASGDLFEKPGMFILKPEESFQSYYEIQTE